MTSLEQITNSLKLNSLKSKLALATAGAALILGTAGYISKAEANEIKSPTKVQYNCNHKEKKHSQIEKGIGTLTLDQKTGTLYHKINKPLLKAQGETSETEYFIKNSKGKINGNYDKNTGIVTYNVGQDFNKKDGYIAASKIVGKNKDTRLYNASQKMKNAYFTNNLKLSNSNTGQNQNTNYNAVNADKSKVNATPPKAEKLNPDKKTSPQPSKNPFEDYSICKKPVQKVYSSHMNAFHNPTHGSSTIEMIVDEGVTRNIKKYSPHEKTSGMITLGSTDYMTLKYTGKNSQNKSIILREKTENGYSEPSNFVRHIMTNEHKLDSDLWKKINNKEVKVNRLDGEIAYLFEPNPWTKVSKEDYDNHRTNPYMFGDSPFKESELKTIDVNGKDLPAHIFNKTSISKSLLHLPGFDIYNSLKDGKGTYGVFVQDNTSGRQTLAYEFSAVRDNFTKGSYIVFNAAKYALTGYAAAGGFTQSPTPATYGPGTSQTATGSTTGITSSGSAVSGANGGTVGIIGLILK